MREQVWVGEPQLWGQLSAIQPDLVTLCVMAHGHRCPTKGQKEHGSVLCECPSRHLGSIPND